MPQITENSALKNHFIMKLQERCAPVRNEIHVSDLTYCLRKAYFRRTEKRKLSEQQLMFFLDGHQRHTILQGLVEHFQNEAEAKKYGVVGHIDLMGNHPIEIKTTRARNNGQKPPHYLRQCAYYCLLTETNTCTLITQYINDATFTFETLKFSDSELDNYERDMIEARDQLQFAFDRKNPSSLPFPDAWQCNYCEFAENCPT